MSWANSPLNWVDEKHTTLSKEDWWAHKKYFNHVVFPDLRCPYRMQAKLLGTDSGSNHKNSHSGHFSPLFKSDVVRGGTYGSFFFGWASFGILPCVGRSGSMAGYASLFLIS